MRFVQCEQGPFGFTSFAAWQGEGILHGFCNAAVNFSSPLRARNRQLFHSSFDGLQLLLMRQAHTAEVYYAGDGIDAAMTALADHDFDGLVAPRVTSHDPRAALGV